MASPAWVCALLNMPGLLALAQSLVLGQTRSRISMGRLRNLSIPVPPVDLQNEFSAKLQAISECQARFADSDELASELSRSVQARAFLGKS
jgi:type I restriction enzyme S subunit